MPLQTFLLTPAQQRINRMAKTEGTGAHQLATYFVGQVVGSLDRVKPTRQVVLDMVDEYIDAITRLNQQLGE